MKIDISSEAVNWFKEELDLPQEQISARLLCALWRRISIKTRL